MGGGVDVLVTLPGVVRAADCDIMVALHEVKVKALDGWHDVTVPIPEACRGNWRGTKWSTGASFALANNTLTVRLRPGPRQSSESASHEEKKAAGSGATGGNGGGGVVGGGGGGGGGVGRSGSTGGARCVQTSPPPPFSPAMPIKVGGAADDANKGEDKKSLSPAAQKAAQAVAAATRKDGSRNGSRNNSRDGSPREGSPREMSPRESSPSPAASFT